MNSSDKNIIRRIRQGDNDVFSTIYDLYYQRIKLYACSYIDDADTAEDIVQDLFFHLWEKREDIEIVTSLSSYLFRAIHNRSIQHLRHQKVISRYQEQHLFKIKEAEILYQTNNDFTINEINVNEIKDIQERIYDSLSPKTKKIFQLSREDDKNNREIASTLDINIKTVEYHISKAIKSFQLALKDYILFLLLLFMGNII